MSRLRRAACRDRGASAVEYGLMIAAVAAVIVGAVFVLGRVVTSAFSHTCAAVAVSIAPEGGAPADCDGSPAGGVQPGPGPVPAGG